ncbi:MAG: OmpA family protein [Polyangiaceae bacterium]
MKRKLGSLLFAAAFVMSAAVMGGCKAQASMSTGPATPTAAPKPADPPKADPPKADPPKADPPKADPPKPADPPKAKITADKDGEFNPRRNCFRVGQGRDQADQTPVLEQVKQYLDENPQVTQLRIEGHTDSDGDDAMNLKLSGARAAAVAAWLVGKGEKKERLLPIASVRPSRLRRTTPQRTRRRTVASSSTLPSSTARLSVASLPTARLHSS